VKKREEAANRKKFDPWVTVKPASSLATRSEPWGASTWEMLNG